MNLHPEGEASPDDKCAVCSVRIARRFSRPTSALLQAPSILGFPAALTRGDSGGYGGHALGSHINRSGGLSYAVPVAAASAHNFTPAGAAAPAVGTAYTAAHGSHTGGSHGGRGMPVVDGAIGGARDWPSASVWVTSSPDTRRLFSAGEILNSASAAH